MAHMLSPAVCILGPFWLQLSFKTGAVATVQDTSFLSHLLFHRLTTFWVYNNPNVTILGVYYCTTIFVCGGVRFVCIICCWDLCSPNCLYRVFVLRRVMSGKPREISSRAQVLKAWKKRKLSAWRLWIFVWVSSAVVGKFPDKKLGHDSLYTVNSKGNLF